ncbi:hypothetical protein GHT06_015271 [Daphnia sinensis]|uniref:Uncharacterized protein n=1 Tax=Daphnia sinensis TaxID=1820382 RepID=A0AAD5KQX2_9CRUS|nr:hypothetical protein GHT06_015271 [Daphnia sinensis]
MTQGAVNLVHSVPTTRGFWRQKYINVWTREHNTAENREKHSWYNTILKEAAVSDHYTFNTATRMTPTIFEGLLQRIAQVGHKQDITFRKCIPRDARALACTSPFL